MMHRRVQNAPFPGRGLTRLETASITWIAPISQLMAQLNPPAPVDRLAENFCKYTTFLGLAPCSHRKVMAVQAPLNISHLTLVAPTPRCNEEIDMTDNERVKKLKESVTKI